MGKAVSFLDRFFLIISSNFLFEMEKSTVMITGASGLLGRALMTKFTSSEAWKNVIGTAFSRCEPNLLQVDLTDLDQIKAMIQEKRPDLLVHAAAQRFPDKMQKDPEQARKLNVSASKTLAEALKDIGSKMLYISTDYVFDGKNPPYKHDSPTNPLNDYGISKLDGEKVVLEQNPDNVVLRIPILYGDVEYLDESAITTLFPKLKNSSVSCEMSDYEIRRPSHVKDIASIVYYLSRMLVGKNAPEKSIPFGIYQWCGSEPLTKYEMVKIMGKVFKLDHKHVKGVKEPSPGAPRPFDTTMDTSRLLDLYIANYHTPFEE